MESKAYHVVPLGDLREHEVSLRCWCKPVQDEEEPNVWVHNSMDQRERYTDAGKLH
jgi:hypothetical protein